MNSCTFAGRLVDPPVLRTTPGGVPMLPFMIAVKRDRKIQPGKKDTDHIRCAAYFENAQEIAENYTQGQTIEITGRYEIREYTEHKTSPAVKCEAHEIIVDKIVPPETPRSAAEDPCGMIQGFSTAGPEDFQEILCGDDEEYSADPAGTASKFTGLQPRPGETHADYKSRMPEIDAGIRLRTQYPPWPGESEREYLNRLEAVSMNELPLETIREMSDADLANMLDRSCELDYCKLAWKKSYNEISRRHPGVNHIEFIKANKTRGIDPNHNREETS